MAEGTPTPQINVSKIPGGGGIAGTLFAVISMLIFLIGIPLVRCFFLLPSLWVAPLLSSSTPSIMNQQANLGLSLTRRSRKAAQHVTGDIWRIRTGRRTQPTRLVVVLETNDQIQFAMAKGLLEDAGIPLFVQGQLATLYQSVDGFLRKWVRVQVPEDRAVEAKGASGSTQAKAISLLSF